MRNKNVNHKSKSEQMDESENAKPMNNNRHIQVTSF